MNQLQETAFSYRCRFEKRGPIRYISHLDLTRAFHRAFSRAKLPLKFSEGFSPHPKFAFALPLSVGTESLVELADFTLKPGFELAPEEIKAALQAQMPVGIHLVEIGEQVGKFSDIAYASYTVTLPSFPAERLEEAKRHLEGEIIIQKKNKKGKWVQKDVSAGIHTLNWEPTDSGVILHATLSASGEHYLKPELILDHLHERMPDAGPEERSILRTGVFKSDLTDF